MSLLAEALAETAVTDGHYRLEIGDLVLLGF